MGYSFNQAAEIDLMASNLSAAAKAVVQDVLTINPFATKKDILEALYNDVESISPSISHSDLYIYIFEEISDGNEPKSGVEASSWQWVRGAIGVNQDDGSFFSDFIRMYTEQQYLMRTGSALGSTAVQDASNDIAKSVAADILVNEELPTISQIGEQDAGAVAARIFEGNYSPWAGTVLFPFLGVDSFSEDWLLKLETSTNKPLSGTYDIIAAAAATYNVIYTLTEEFSFGQLWDIRGQIVDTIENNNLGASATEELLEDLRSTANAFFQNAYGVGNWDDYQIGNHMPWFAPSEWLAMADFLLHPNGQPPI